MTNQKEISSSGYSSDTTRQRLSDAAELGAAEKVSRVDGKNIQTCLVVQVVSTLAVPIIGFYLGTPMLAVRLFLSGLVFLYGIYLAIRLYVGSEAFEEYEKIQNRINRRTYR